MKYKLVPLEIYISHLQEYIMDRMQYHNNNGNGDYTLAIGEEFFELFDPEDDSEIFFSYRLKGIK